MGEGMTIKQIADLEIGVSIIERIHFFEVECVHEPTGRKHIVKFDKAVALTRRNFSQSHLVDEAIKYAIDSWKKHDSITAILLRWVVSAGLDRMVIKRIILGTVWLAGEPSIEDCRDAVVRNFPSANYATCQFQDGRFFCSLTPKDARDRANEGWERGEACHSEAWTSAKDARDARESKGAR